MNNLTDYLIVSYIVLAIVGANYVRYFTDLCDDKRSTFIWVSIRAFFCSLLSLFWFSFVWKALADVGEEISLAGAVFISLLFGTVGLICLAFGVIGKLKRKPKPAKKSEDRIRQEECHKKSMHLLEIAAEMTKNNRPESEILRTLDEAEVLRKEFDRLERVINEKNEKKMLAKRLLFVVGIIFIIVANFVKK